MSIFEKLKSHARDLQACALELLQDLTEDAVLLEQLGQLEQVFRTRPDLIPSILSFARGLLEAENNREASSEEAFRPVVGNLVPTVGQGPLPNLPTSGGAERLPDGADGVPGGSYGEDNDQALAAFRVPGRTTAGGSSASPTAQHCPGIGRDSTTGKGTSTPMQQRECACGPVVETETEVETLDLRQPAEAAEGPSQTPVDTGAQYAVEDLRAFSELVSHVSRRSLSLHSALMYLPDRALQLADLQRPFIEAAVANLQPPADAREAAGVCEARDVQQATTAAQAEPADDPTVCETAGVTDAVAAVPPVAAVGDAALAARDAAAAPTLAENETAAADVPQDVATKAVPGSTGHREIPPASPVADEDALMEDAAEYHTPRSWEDEEELLVPSSLRLRSLRQEQQLAELPQEQQPELQLQLEGGTQAESSSEAGEEDEEDEEDQEDVDEDVMFYYGHPVRGFCSNWPGTRLSLQRDMWVNEFKHRVRLQLGAGGVTYLWGHKNTRREFLKFFLHNADGPLSADGPGDDDDGGGGGTGGANFFVCALKRSGAAAGGNAADAAGYADDGLDIEQEEDDDSTFLNDIRHPEEDEFDDDFVSDSSDEEEGEDNAEVAEATAGGEAAEEDLDETAEMDDPPLRTAPPRQPAAPVAGAGEAGKAGDGGAGVRGGRRKTTAPARRMVVSDGNISNGGDYAGVLFSNSVLPSGVREMVRELASRGAFVASSAMTQIETKYTRAALAALMEALSTEVARIKSEWHDSKARVQLEAQALRWWRESRQVVSSAIAGAVASAEQAPARTLADAWREQLKHLEDRILSVCREVATSYVDKADAFSKDRKKYALMLEGTVQVVEELKYKLLAASKTQEQVEAWQQQAAKQLRSRWPEDGDKAPTRRRKDKKRSDRDSAVGDFGAPSAAGINGDGTAKGPRGEAACVDDEDDEGEDESEDGSYDSFIDDADAEELVQEAVGMEVEANADRGAKSEDEAEEADEEGAGGPTGPTAIVGLAPNQTEVLLGIKARDKKAAKRKSAISGDVQLQQGQSPAAEVEAGVKQAAEQVAGPTASGDSAGGAAAGSSGTSHRMDLDEPPAQPDTTLAVPVHGDDAPIPLAAIPGGDAKDADAAEGTAAAAEPAVVDVAQTGEQGRDADEPAETPAAHGNPLTPINTGRSGDGEDADVQVTGTVEVARRTRGRTSGTAGGTPPQITPGALLAALGADADVRAVGPQSMELEGAVDVLLGPSGAAEQPACRTMYRAWHQGGRILGALGNDMFSVVTASGGPPKQLPASSLRPALGKGLRNQAGRPELRKGALLQVRETDADGIVVWKPVLVLAVVRAYDKAAALSWAQLHEQLPGRVPVCPAWERHGDWTWAQMGGTGGAGPSAASPHGPAPATAHADDDINTASAVGTAAVTVAQSKGSASVHGYGDASYVNSLAPGRASEAAAAGSLVGSAEAEPLLVRLLYLHEYLQKKDRGILEKLVAQVPVEQLLGQRRAVPLLWWSQRKGRMKGVWHVVEGDPGLKSIETEMFNRVTDVRLVQQLLCAKNAAAAAAKQDQEEEEARRRRQQQLSVSGVEQTQPDEQVQKEIQQARQMADEKRLRNQMVHIMARRLRRRFYTDVPQAHRRFGQPRRMRLFFEGSSKRRRRDQNGSGGKTSRKPSPHVNADDDEESADDEALSRRKRKRGADETENEDTNQERSHSAGGAPEATPSSASSDNSDTSDSSIGTAVSSSEDDSDVQGAGEGSWAAGRGARGRGRGSAAAGRGLPANRPNSGDASARALVQKQKQKLKQRQEMKKLLEEALAKRQAKGGEVQGGDVGSRPLFENRQAPKVAACFARRLKAHQLQGLRFMWENLVDNHALDALNPAEQETTGGCILAHSMGLGKTLSTIAFLHMFLGQAMSTASEGRGEDADADGLQGRRRAVLVVPANVLYNFYTEFMVWLPEQGSADAALSRLTGKKVHMLQGDEQSVDKWYAEEGSVLLMSTRKFINLAMLSDGKGTKAAAITALGRRRGRTPSRLAGKAAEEQKGGVEEPDAAAMEGGGEDGREVDSAPADPRRARVMELRRMVLEGCSLVVVDEAHELRNPESQLYQAMCSLPTRRRLALTGYPLQNNLEEYYTMLTWVQGDLLGDPRSFRLEFAQVIKKGQQANASRAERMASNKRLVVLNEITADFIHRAGPEILERELPPKSEVVLLLDLNDRQREYYEAYLKEQEALPKSADRYKLFRDFEVLRKVMNNPHDFEDLLARAVAGGGMSIIQAEGYEGGDEDIQFQVTPVGEPSRGGGRPTRRMPLAGPPGVAATAGPRGPPGGDAAGEAGGRGTTRRLTFAAGDPMDTDAAVAGPPVTGADADGAGGTAVAVAGGTDTPGVPGGSKAAGKTNKGKETLQLPLELCERLLKRLKEQREALKAAVAAGNGGGGGGGARNLEGVDPLWGPLPKQMFVEHLLRVCQANNEKLVVFSQSLNVLNALQATLLNRFRYRLGIEFFRIDGAVMSKQRHDSIDKFNSNSKARVILVSSRAGSLGINLTTACRMVIFDVPWNPVFNAQAIARIYRFGQTRPTFVYRLLYAATLEELVYDLNVDKEELFNKVVDKKLVRKAQPAAGERWTYTAPTRMAAEVARRRLEELADPATAAAVVAAANAASAPQRAPGSSGAAAAAAAAAAVAAAAEVASGLGGQVVDAKDYALLQLAKEPEVQGCLVNAYLHKSKLPPDPLGDLTAEDKILARQQYQAEVGGDGGRRLRRLRRMVQDSVDMAAATGAGGDVAQAAEQGRAQDPEAHGHSTAEQLRSGNSSGSAAPNLNGTSAGPSAAAMDDVDPVLQDLTGEEEAARRPGLQQHRHQDHRHHRQSHQQPGPPQGQQQKQVPPPRPQQLQPGYQQLQQQQGPATEPPSAGAAGPEPSLPGASNTGVSIQKYAQEFLSTVVQFTARVTRAAAKSKDADVAAQQGAIPRVPAPTASRPQPPRAPYLQLQPQPLPQAREPGLQGPRKSQRGGQLPGMGSPTNALVPQAAPAPTSSPAPGPAPAAGPSRVAPPLPASWLSSGQAQSADQPSGPQQQPPQQQHPMAHMVPQVLPEQLQRLPVGAQVDRVRTTRSKAASRRRPEQQGTAAAARATEARTNAPASGKRARPDDDRTAQGSDSAAKRQRQTQQNPQLQGSPGAAPAGAAAGAAAASNPAAPATGVLEAGQQPVRLVRRLSSSLAPGDAGGVAQQPRGHGDMEDGSRLTAAPTVSAGAAAARPAAAAPRAEVRSKALRHAATATRGLGSPSKASAELPSLLLRGPSKGPAVDAGPATAAGRESGRADGVKPRRGEREDRRGVADMVNCMAPGAPSTSRQPEVIDLADDE